jgi:hypothetical protein
MFAFMTFETSFYPCLRVYEVVVVLVTENDDCFYDFRN